jgi:hypothetical protein
MNRLHTTSRCKRECMRMLTEYVKMSHYNTRIDEKGYGEPSISQSLQAKDRDRQSSCSPSHNLHPTCEKREMSESWIPKG